MASAAEKSNYDSSAGYQLHVMSPLTKLFTFNWLYSSKSCRSWRLLLQIIKYSGISWRARGPHFFLVLCDHIVAFLTLEGRPIQYSGPQNFPRGDDDVELQGRTPSLFCSFTLIAGFPFPKSLDKYLFPVGTLTLSFVLKCIP